ncbi:MAG: zinc ribbon domain-containing protein [Pyrinomonadaceae bacterium]
MAETLVKEKICSACGVEVRPQAMFCYNCGSAVAPDFPLSKNENKKISKAWFRDGLVGENSEETAKENYTQKDKTIEELFTADNHETAAAKIDDAKSGTEAAEVEKVEKAEKRELSKMDSAANLRRRRKSVQKKRVEIVWEEHDNAPNGWFIFFAVILVGLAVTIWVISTYLE